VRAFSYGRGTPLLCRQRRHHSEVQRHLQGYLAHIVGMLYGLFCIDFCELNYVGAIDVVVWQGGVNLSDSERWQTLHIAALWCLLNPRALTLTVRPRDGQFWAVLAPRFLCPLIRRQGPRHLGDEKRPSPLGPPQGPRLTPTLGSWGGAVSYKRGTPVLCAIVLEGGRVRACAGTRGVRSS
jgi:hypothetical protein